MMKIDRVKFVLGSALVHALVAMANIWVDFEPLSGDEGLIPHSRSQEQVQAEFDTLSVVQFFPSLLYWAHPITLLNTGMMIVVVGLFQLARDDSTVPRLSCFSAYLVLLSFSQCQGLVLWFPWDCLLFETLIIAAVCPEVSWVFRFLLFRVMFGFGKHKFFGADSLDDLTYTASMACWQPLGSSVGYLLTWLPDWVHIGSILLTWFLEIVCPFALICERLKPYRQISAIMTILLMAMIQISGHYGWFNTLSACLAFSVLLETNPDPPTDSSPAAVVRISYIVIGILFLIPSQWNSPSLFYQHTFDLAAFDIVRTVSSWRLVHSYGVFPPKKMPMIKPVGRFEVLTNDTSQALNYHYQVSQSTHETDWHPFTVAPFRFPRFDYIYAFYSASHVFSFATRLGPTIGSGEEYIDSVLRFLANNTRNEGIAKSLFRSEIPRHVIDVKFFVVGLVPEFTGGWKEISVELDRQGLRNQQAASLTDMLPPNMIVLRRRSKLFSRDIDVADLIRMFPDKRILGHRLFDSAVSRVKDPFLSEREWFTRVYDQYSQLTKLAEGVPPLISDCSSSEPGVWDLCHASQFGGYIGCLTFAHLVPYPLHAPLCPAIMVSNFFLRRHALNQSPFNKIPVPDLLYWILGLADDVSPPN